MEPCNITHTKSVFWHLMSVQSQAGYLVDVNQYKKPIMDIITLDVLQLWSEFSIGVFNYRHDCKLLDFISSEYDNPNLLDWAYAHIIQQGANIREYYTDFALNIASLRGHIHMVLWWARHLTHNPISTTRQSILPLMYTNNAVDSASGFNHIEILNIWLQLYIRKIANFKYSEYAMNSAAWCGHIEVLNWWLNVYVKFKIPLKWSSAAIDTASQNGLLSILDWWLNAYLKYGLEFKYSAYAMDSASVKGHLHILDWWFNINRKYKLPLKWTFQTINHISKASAVFNWWRRSGLIH
jgi:hypothetical protein